MVDVLRLAAFTFDPAGGNPAGVVLDASDLDDATMQRIARHVGDAETAFLVAPGAPRAPRVSGESSPIAIRYFSPTAEVPFCGHATIATAVVLAEQALAAGRTPSTFAFATPVGPVTITTSIDQDGRVVAAFTSVEPTTAPIDPAVLDRLTALLRVPVDVRRASSPTDGAGDRRTGGAAAGVRSVTARDLAPGFPPMLASAGNTHPVLVLADRRTFDAFGFDPDAMRALMDEQGWAGTVTILHPVGPGRFEARNLFPVGTMDEDPATGSAAASVGGYLRALGLVEPPAHVVIEQGRHVGRPGVLHVDVPVSGGIVVSGTAVVIPG
ncbi:PhzF family phenazine biosynthesis protein [Curtobacterium sp. RRHDQ10]|uniref:PhzF family phenazine biosynthesis protein n=1 Tax=Curtobacterium phyllosphaerae TaxID=3413379 RepID=UPI003BF1087C